MNTFKKIVAIVAIASIVTGSVSFAANTALDNATANVTLDNSVAVETLTVNVSGKDFSSDAANFVEIRDNAGTIAYTGSTITTNVNGSFTIDADFDASLNTSTRYTINFKTVANDFGSAVLVINNDNQLTVTATVQPVLKFGMESTSLSFGNLTTSYKQVTTGLEVGTNAINGVTITAESTNGGLNSATTSHKINDTTDDSVYDAEGYQFLSTLGANDGATTGATITNLSADDVTYATPGTTNVKTVYTANKPQNFDTTGDYDVDFTVQTKIAESTPAASDYTDVIVFTATANF